MLDCNYVDLWVEVLRLQNSSIETFFVINADVKSTGAQ
jgi:hypothetical protein